MVIDSHVHFWKYDRVRDSWITNDMQVLQQDYLPGNLSEILEENEVDAVVAVQADQRELETFFLKALAETHPVIKGVVGWIDLQNENIEERLQYFSQFPIIKGWRHIVQAEPDDFLLRVNLQRGIRALQPYNYTYDILVYHNQLRPVLDFVNKFPGQKFVVDHCAKPGIENKKMDDWKAMMKDLAQHPNVYCKLSGLFTEAKWKEWTVADFSPYLEVVFEAFGTNRLLFGSDWPVMLLSGMYTQWKNMLEKYMENFVQEEKQKVFGDNAVTFYNL